MDTLKALGEIGLGSRLKRLSDQLMKIVQGVYDHHEIDFDPYLFPAFYQIATTRTTTATDLIDTLLTSQPAVTQTLAKLHQRGLIVWDADPNDKRRKLVRLSPLGKQRYLQVQPLWRSMDKAVKRYTQVPADSLLEHLALFERVLTSGEFTETVEHFLEEDLKIQMVDFDPAYARAFYDLNIEWLETFFYVEDYDREVLSKPNQYILKPGGHIFFAIEDHKALGTVALMPYEPGIFELTKMAVSPQQRGKKIGQRLMQHCIDFARHQGCKALILYSNRILENAIHIYRKFGFEEIPVEPDSPYERSNIKMKLLL